MNTALKLTSAVALAAILIGCSDNREVLEIYTWSDYFEPELLQRFETENNCTVNITTFDSNEAMYAKLKAGATGYDILTPSSYMIPLLAKEGIIRPLNHMLLHSVTENFSHDYNRFIIDPKMEYSVPYIVSYSGIMYNRKHVKFDAPPSWSVFSDSRFLGKVSLLDDIREVIGIGLMYNGYSINSENPAEIDKAADTIVSWRKNIRKFDAESYKTEVSSGSLHFGHAYSSDSFQVILGDEENGKRDDIGFTYPKEGYSVACDEFVITASSSKSELAHRFVDFIYGVEESKTTMEYNVSAVPNSKAIELLDESYRKLIVLDGETAARGQVIKQFEKNETQELYNLAWDRIRSIKK